MLATLAGPSRAEPRQPINFDLPIACKFGATCFIQQYFDHDPGPGAKDYRCGVMSNDGHDGVDLRLPTMADQQRGVAVLAAATGIVKAVRDGMADVNMRTAGSAGIDGRECGNGVVIAHDGGWETQYCHMAQRSIRVAVGQKVTKGTVLGLVGLSGATEFPHLHFSVRISGIKVDPFAWDAPPGRCGTGHSLWSQSAAQALAYHSPDVINAGFASGPVTITDVESGRTAAAAPARGSSALVVFVRAIGLEKGDILRLALTAPDGSILAQNTAPPLDHDKAQWLTYVGKKRIAVDWASGHYLAKYEVRRGSAIALTKQFGFDLQ